MLTKAKQPSMRMVAERAGVSLATVSNLLRGSQGRIRVSEETKGRVFEVCKDLGYEPNVHAQRMFCNKSKTLGLIIPPSGSILGGESSPDIGLAGFIQGVTDACQSPGYQVVINIENRDFIDKKTYLRLYRNKSIDALVIWGIQLESPYISELHNQNLPFILVQTRTNILDQSQYNFIGTDDIGGAQKCVEHLFELGHRKIGYVRGCQSSSVGFDRWQGYCNAMDKHNLNYANLVVDGDYSFASGKLAASKLLEKNPEITAVACANDLMAAGVIEYLEEAGLSVPNDVSVTGADAVPHFWAKQITSCRVSVYDMGAKAAENIIKRLTHADEKEHVREMFDCQLRIGRTTTGVK